MLLLLLFCVFSVFEGMPIPYPKREFLTGDDNDDKADTGASKVGDKVRVTIEFCYFIFFVVAISSLFLFET